MDHEREFNPYRAPRSMSAPPRPAGPDGWADMPTSVPGHHGLLWLRQAARIVATRPGPWAGAFCLTAAAPMPAMLVADSTTPILLCFVPFWPVLTGGIVSAAHKQRQGETIRLRDIFVFFRSWAHCFMWAGVGLFVTGLMVCVFALLTETLPALLHMLWMNMFKTTFPPSLHFVLLAALTVALVAGNVFIAAAVALHGEWPLRVIVRAGPANMPAFLLNWTAMTLIILLFDWLNLLSSDLPFLVPWWTAAEWFFVALVAYAAVRDIFFVPEKATAQPAAAS